MSILILNREDDLWLNTLLYGGMLHVAHIFGWKPAGTKRPTAYDEYDDDGNLIRIGIEDWDGNYHEDYLQEVTEEDAANLVAALDKAIAFLSWLRAIDPELVTSMVSDSSAWKHVLRFRSARSIGLLERFKDAVEGGFRIG